MSLITPALLTAAKADPRGASLYGPFLAAAADRRGIVSHNALLGLLPNVQNESGGMTCVSEDLFYRSPAWIAQVFSSHFPGGAREAQAFACNSRALGDRVYAAIGPAQGGYAARGLGLGQVTGDANHLAYARDVGRSLADARAYMLTPEGAADSACWYFVSRGCAEPAERGDLLAVRQIWAGNRSSAPMGWLDAHGGPGPVQKWAAQVRAALGGAVKPVPGSVSASALAPPTPGPVPAPFLPLDFPG